MIEAAGRTYGKRVLVGTAPSHLEGRPAVRAFAPFQLNTVEKLSGRYVAWLARMVIEALEVRGGDSTRAEWQTMTSTELTELIKTGGNL
jgi:hypothetical protein